MADALSTNDRFLAPALGRNNTNRNDQFEVAPAYPVDEAKDERPRTPNKEGWGKGADGKTIRSG